jgi:hypothetical protein
MLLMFSLEKYKRDFSLIIVSKLDPKLNLYARLVRLLKKVIEARLFLASATAKEVTGVFTSINSISLTSSSGPFGFYDIQLGWSINTN